MKILKICGIVAGLHVLALILIFANPGCSSSKAQTKAADAPQPAADASLKAEPPPASIAVPNASPADAPAGLAPSADSSASAPGILFSPTRPGTAAAAALQAQPVADVTPASTYTVGQGDSLWTIAKKNHLKVSALATANHLKSGSSLHIGQKLIIPGAAPAGASAPISSAAAESPAAQPAAAAPASGDTIKYVVRSGETLGAIARKFNVRVGAIATDNNISDPQKIHSGQTLIIRGGHGGAAHSSRAPKTAPASAPAESAPAPAEPAAPIPPPVGQDLDSGLKSAPDSGAAPVLKVDEPPPPKS